MWEIRNRKAAILTTVLLAFVLLLSTGLPQLVGAQTDSSSQAAEATEALAEGTPDGNDDVGSATAQLTAYRRAINYPEYLAQYDEVVRPDREIVIPAVSLSNLDTEIKLLYDYEGMPGISVQTSERGFVEWEVDIEEAGFYNIEITYYPVTGRSAPIQRAVDINGTRPFSEAGYLVLHRTWGDGGPVETDIYGNQLRPRQVEKPLWRTEAFIDPTGYENVPFLFYFKEGTNTIRLDAVSEGLIIHSLRLFQYDEPLPYEEVRKVHEESGYKPTSGIYKQLEGEAAVYRSSPTIMPVHDMGDPTLVPYHPAQIRLNSIGGTGWKTVGDWATWEFEVPESGLYQIAIKGKQDQRRGIYTSRQLFIDGKVPFKEADALKFRFDNRYDMIVPTTEDGETALVYLEAGKHELTLKAVLGDVAGLIRKIENLIYDLNTIYRRIIMITSGQPDPLRSYELDKKIPGLIDALREQAAILRSVADEFESFTGQRGGHIATLTTFARVLEDMADRPHAIPSLLGEYRDNVGALGTWLNQTMEQPVQIDFIVVASPDQTLPNPRPTALQTWLHEIKAFIASFTYDYTRVGDRGLLTDTDEVLRVWIGSGRDQAQALKQMIEDSFTPATGIPVDLELIQSMDSLLIPSIIAGTGPDVALGASNMDLAFRNALADLSQFEDFEEVAQRFMKSAFVPFRFRDKVYALPEVQGFPMLFYRKDILAELGLEVPQTWEDVYAIIPELQKENMDFGLRANTGTYQMFLYQQGVPLFKEDVIMTNLDAEVAVQTFKDLTQLYTLHNLLYEYNEANRFRTGEMPLLIANYGLYNTLSVFAPELRGEWGMTMVPGTVMEDGTINRAVPVAGTAVAPGAVAVPAGTSGAVILETSKRKEWAWEFLKWWTSTEIQARFGREMESLMGAAARYATANVEALTQLPWNVHDRDVLLEQWKWVEGVPAVLGGYYVTRQFDWLFRAVVFRNEPLRESILEYNRKINEEITRKREEFGLETDYSKLDQELKDLYWSHYTHLYRLEIEKQ
ncbi:MAG TPA: extracellular solute-binding protein [Firmicutes bacterium]|nr:extracellular solute-binding protein [Bacillota bacterium]